MRKKARKYARKAERKRRWGGGSIWDTLEKLGKYLRRDLEAAFMAGVRAARKEAAKR